MGLGVNMDPKVVGFVFTVLIGASLIGGTVIGVAAPFVLRGIKYVFSSSSDTTNQMLQNRVAELEKLISEINKKNWN